MQCLHGICKEPALSHLIYLLTNMQIRDDAHFETTLRPWQVLNPGHPGQKSNALTTEPKSQLPDAGCQRLYLSYSVY